ncbi:MAG: S26 family signal peptidase, partial [Candidatus Lokiarchaeota archaeon]
MYNNGLTEGYIITKVQDPSVSTIKTQGIDPSECDQLSPKLLAAAAEQGYDLDENIPLQKLPLSDLFGGFNYPVDEITLYGFVDGEKVDKKVTLYSESDSDYSIESNAITRHTASDLQAGNVNKGLFFEKNLYLTEGIEDILPLSKTSGKEKYYMVEIKVHTIVPDLTYDEELTKDALSQSTSYAIMDYFDQFQYAQSTAMMTAEIGYTGLLTLTSTLLSTPLIILGSYATAAEQETSNTIASQTTNVIMKTALKEAEKTAEKSIQSIALNVIGGAVTRSISEVFEEIFIDSIVEGAVSNFATKICGLSADAGHWLSVLATTARETKGFTELMSNTNTKKSQSIENEAKINQAQQISADYKTWYTASEMGYAIGDPIEMIDALGLTGEINANIRNEQKAANRKKILASGLLTVLGAIVPFVGFVTANLGMSFFMDGISESIIQTLNEKISTKQFNKYLARALEKQQEKLDYTISRPLVNTQTDFTEYINTVAQNKMDMVNLLQKSPSLPQALSNGYHVNLKNTISQKISEDFFAEKVNSQPDLLGNSIEIKLEKVENNLAQLEVIGDSMKGIPELQPGARLPVRLKTEGIQYKKGDIIMFYRDEIRIVHRVEYVYKSNGKTFYVTEGVNRETNPIVDKHPVCEDDVIGKVDLSLEVYQVLNEMMARRYIPTFKANAMTQRVDMQLETFIKTKYTWLRNALNRAEKLGNYKGLKLVSSKDGKSHLEFEEFALACKGSWLETGRYGDAELTWIHVGKNGDGCGETFTSTYNQLYSRKGTCPRCDPRWKNQWINHRILEALFGQKFGEEVYLKD